jgi:hypothetical protein
MTAHDFSYTGAAQSYLVPAGVTAVLLEAWGGSDTTAHGGYSARIQSVTAGETLQVNVAGSAASGGWNGGGAGARPGAGATDWRQGGTALANRVLVAGGAGSHGSSSGSLGGAGGADVGQTASGGLAAGSGGTQSSGGFGGFDAGDFGGPGTGGTLGVGGVGFSSLCGCGGGGYYGGGGGGDGGVLGPDGYGGGGGSNHGGTLANVRGVASPGGTAHGYARVTLAGLTVTPDAINTPPRYAVSLIGATGTTVTVNRVDSAGVATTLRGAEPATLVSGGWIGYDYEAPYNEPLTYVATTDAGSTYTVAVAALREYGAQQGWLVHPGAPDLSIPLNGPVIGDETRDVLEGVHVVLGRAEPVTITDGARKAPAFELTIKATSKAEDDAVRALLADTSTLLLQYVFPFTDLYDYYWVSVGQATRARMTGDYSEPYYRWTLPCTVTSAPSGLQQAQWAYADVLADYASYSAVAAAFISYSDVVTNDPIGG